MEITVKHLFIFCAVWFIAGIIGITLKNKIKTVKVNFKPNDSFKKADSKYMATTSANKEITFNLIFSKDNEIPEELLFDLTVKFDDLLAGTYKLPDKFLKNNANQDNFKQDLNEIEDNGIVLSADDGDYGDKYHSDD